MIHVDPIFKPRIDFLDLQSFELSSDIICFLDSKLKLVGFNSFYLAFVNNIHFDKSRKKNIKIPLFAYFRKFYLGAINDNRVFQYNYKARSNKSFYFVHQTAYPIYGAVGLIVTNHRILENDGSNINAILTPDHLSPQNFVIQCSHCKKIQNHAYKLQWDWFPRLANRPPSNTSHSICLYCLEHYYPDVD